jgi:hypothetical protein
MSDNYTLTTGSERLKEPDEKETLSSDEQTQNYTVTSARDAPKA